MKPSIPKGTRDFSPTEVANRTYIMNTIKRAFETFGFQPIETPSFENSSTLMGKYGEEGDRLIFKILNSGDYFKKLSELVTNAISQKLIILLRKIINNDDFSLDDFFKKELINVNSLLGLESGNSLELWNEELISATKISINENKSDFIELFTFCKINKYKFNDIFKDNEETKVISNIASFAFAIWTQKAKTINISEFISEKALRYDLTVPFARYVVQHQNDITFPFKRYQIQPVWRADRPQKGRFREFFQCDADVVGSKSLLQEVEFIQLYDTVFTNLGLAGTTIKMNNRKILSGIAEVIGASDKLIDFTVALDKLDKIGKDGVVKEMLSKGITEKAIEKVQPLFDFSGSNLDKLASLENMLSTSEEGLQGVKDLRFVINTITKLGLQTATLEIDVTLARGLNYYTGAIFEVSAPEGVQMGSIGGGGRYDDLTGIFGLKDVSGVGISFGLDRIYLVLEELGLFKSVDLPKPKVLFLNFNEAEILLKMKAIKRLRDNTIKSELYPDVATSNKQQKKQFKYATNRAIEFVVTEIVDGKFTVKHNGEQLLLSVDELIEKTK